MPPQGNMRQRVGNRMGRMYNLFPQWLTQYGMAVNILALLVSSLMYSSYALPWYHMLSGIVAVVVFFIYGHSLIEQTSEKRIHKTKAFEKQMFRISFIIRIVWTILIYIIFMQAYGDAFGFENGDALLSDDFGKDFAYGFRNNKFLETWRNLNLTLDVSDLGYATYVGFIYWIIGNEAGLMVVRLLKCILSAITVLLIYRLALRNFGDQVARVAAIFVALWPNFWYECGTHLKEVEMVFLSVLFVEQADQMLRSRQFSVWKVVPLLLIASILLTFRTPLALVAFLSLIFSVVMSSSRVVNWGKRITVGALTILLIGVTMGNFLQEKSSELMGAVRGGEQQRNMEWRTTRDNANAFSKYAGNRVCLHQ